jgi:carbonic anhydrase
VYRLHKEELNAILNEKKRSDRFVELNVLEQINNLKMVTFVREYLA